MNGRQCAEICGRAFIIIALSYNSFPKVLFTQHSGFADSNLPQICLENLHETWPRGRIKESCRYDRLMEHIVYAGLQ